jgi:hypothetical protein
MARIAGRKGVIYLGLASDTALATPLPFQATWAINFGTDKADVTAMGDNNKVYVSDLPDASGTFSGFYDDATAQTYTAAIDGLPRKFYLYPTSANPTTYFFGTILPDFSVDGGVGDAVKVSSSWSAASSIVKVG